MIPPPYLGASFPKKEGELKWNMQIKLFALFIHEGEFIPIDINMIED
jgi:hypothetical protein